MAEVDAKWNAMAQRFEITSWVRMPNGDIQYLVKIEDGQPATRYIADSFSGKVPDRNPVIYELTENQARDLMEALQRHFGAYAGVDYERLRKDYDRVTAEADRANDYIRTTLQTILEGRKNAAPKAPVAP